MRRAVLTALALVLVVVGAVAAVPASAAGGVFPDVDADTPFAADIEWLAAEGIATGGTDGRFRPTAPVSRRAMAVMLYRFDNPGTAPSGCTRRPYDDVPVQSSYCGYIAWLKAEGITTGTSSGGFSPLATVTRRAMAVFLHRLAHTGASAPACTVAPYSDVPTTSSFCGAIDWLYAAGVTTVPLHSAFDPTDGVSRGAMAAFLHRFSVARTTPLGTDVSYPQCGAALPTGQAFGIVGVNRGKPGTWNPCMTAQLAWAAGSSGGTSQPEAQLYVNTANPGDVTPRVASWPTSGTNRFGTCTGSNTAACAYAYGEARAAEDLGRVTDPSAYAWWLDVEQGNSWGTTSDGRTRNRAVLEGMADTLGAAGVATVGLYSTAVQWTAIVGPVPAGSPLLGRPSWLAGASGFGPATRMCDLPPLTSGGTVTMVQFVEGGFDRNHACT